MGEAKRRKESDMTFGVPRRGLIISSPIELDVENKRCLLKGSEIDAQELRYATLFWDRLVWPSPAGLTIAGGNDEKFLEKTGILKRMKYDLRGEMAQVVLDSFIHAYNDLNAAEPGAWAVSYGDETLKLPANSIDQKSRAQIELYRAIPVPDVDVHIYDILEFKRKRRDELLSLRKEIDDLVSQLGIDQGDDRDLLEEKIKPVDLACSNAIKVSKEWQFPVRLCSVKCSFEVKPFELISVGTVAFAAINGVDLPKSTGILLSIATAAYSMKSSLKISGDFAPLRGLKPQVGAYAYVPRFHRELF